MATGPPPFNNIVYGLYSSPPGSLPEQGNSEVAIPKDEKSPIQSYYHQTGGNLVACGTSGGPGYCQATGGMGLSAGSDPISECPARLRAISPRNLLLDWLGAAESTLRIQSIDTTTKDSATTAKRSTDDLNGGAFRWKLGRRFNCYDSILDEQQRSYQLGSSYRAKNIGGFGPRGGNQNFNTGGSSSMSPGPTDSRKVQHGRIRSPGYVQQRRRPTSSPHRLSS
ncbi:hypothetical protein E8E14_009384 [Neopestalotiopsis sp. 37M]|nr:hypothetical protein E8E14_009384 [Neopestalotiopsis sp. 37M]